MIETVDGLLKDKKLNMDIHIETGSCFRFCPDKRIAFTLNNRLSMSLSHKAKGLVKEVLSLLK